MKANPYRTARAAWLPSAMVSWTGFLLDRPTFMEATIPQIVKHVQTVASSLRARRRETRVAVNTDSGVRLT